MNKYSTWTVAAIGCGISGGLALGLLLFLDEEGVVHMKSLPEFLRMFIVYLIGFFAQLMAQLWMLNKDPSFKYWPTLWMMVLGSVIMFILFVLGSMLITEFPLHFEYLPLITALFLFPWIITSFIASGFRKVMIRRVSGQERVLTNQEDILDEHLVEDE